MKMRLLFLCASALLLGACSTVNPIADDKAPVLKGDEGILGLEFRSNGMDSQITIVPITGSGGKLYIPDLPIGERVILFVAPVGRYCMRQFKAYNRIFTAKQDDQCFDVVAGKLAYGGTFIPHVGLLSEGQGGGMSQIDTFDEFDALLRQQYPHVAATYLDHGP